MVNNDGENSANAKVTKDINLSNLPESDTNKTNWTPIGKSNNHPFTGVFDGGGFTISGLVINIEDSVTYNEYVEVFAGLFGCIIGDETESGGNRGVVKNVNVVDAKINVTITGNAAPSAGIIAGYCAGDIIGCSTGGTVNVTTAYGYNVGGIAGNLYGSVTDCTNTASITFKDMESGIAGSVGGIVGYAKSVSNIINCTNRGAVTGGARSNAAGIVSTFSLQSEMPEAAVIEGCKNSGEVTGNVAGGIAGSIYEVGGVVAPQISMTSCTNSGNVIGIGTDSYSILVGGIVGFVMNSVVNLENSSTHGTVTSGREDAYCGGIAGYLIGDAEVNADAATTWDKASNPTLTEIGSDPNYTTGATAQEQTMYKITAAAGEGGTITPDDEYWVIEGESQTFTVKANDGYVIDKVTVDGQAQTDVSDPQNYSHTFQNVNAAHTIEASFIKADDSKTPNDDNTNANTGGGGGGCSAGFGALALLALAPMMLRRKK